MPFLNRKWTILSNSTTQYYSKISRFKLLDVYPEMSRKFQFSFLTQKHAWKLIMKKDIFLWCRHRVKNWLKTVCTLNCKSTRLWNDNEFMPSNLHAFLWRTSTHTLWRHCWQHKRIWIWLKKKKKSIEFMQGCTLKRLMLCQIKCGLLLKISNYHSCVFISRQCSKK